MIWDLKKEPLCLKKLDELIKLNPPALSIEGAKKNDLLLLYGALNTYNMFTELKKEIAEIKAVVSVGIPKSP